MSTSSNTSMETSSVRIEPLAFLYRGNQVTQSKNDVLQAISLRDLVYEIKESNVLKLEISRLRKVAGMDKQAYQRLKTRLPYFTGATYRGGIRHGEHFESISFFVLDLDHFPNKEVLLEKRKMLQADERIQALFVSPGGLGLKLVFQLETPSSSLKGFSDFYKTFCFRFSEQYQLGEYLDTATSDATRVCFLSYDPEVYFNPLALGIRTEDYIPNFQTELTRVFAEHEQKTAAKTEAKPEAKPALPESVYQDIRKVLNPQGVVKYQAPQRPVFVPEALYALDVPIRALAAQCQLVFDEPRDIQYGRKMSFRKGLAFAEINVFFGKCGFSVVVSPKRGSDIALAEVCKELVLSIIYG